MSNVFECRICGNTNSNQPFIATERMLGLRDEFVYFECFRCGCVQIEEIPENISKYYPQEYYSYQEPHFANEMNPVLYFLKKSLAKYYIGKFNLTGWLLSFFFEHPFPWLRSDLVDFDSKILDVGCGSGRNLLSMHRSGFRNLNGIDPFNNADIIYDNGVKILKKEVFEIDEKYDFIMLHHSFEHLSSPKAVLTKLFEILKPEGHLLIRIPVANSYAWRKYRACWYALDAPRHFFLHTTHSMQLMAETAGLTLDQITYDYYDFPSAQFVYSEKYLRNIPPLEGNNLFSKKEISHFSKEASRLNRMKDGDSACFLLSKRKVISDY